MRLPRLEKIPPHDSPRAHMEKRDCGKTICNFQKLQKNLVSAHFHCKFISELQKQKKHSGGKTGSALRETDSEIVSSIAYEERQNMNTPEDSYISLILNNYHKNILWFNTGIFLNYRAACSKIRLYFILWYWLCFVLIVYSRHFPLNWKTKRFLSPRFDENNEIPLLKLWLWNHRAGSCRTQTLCQVCIRGS